jgi:hypothetical protein
MDGILGTHKSSHVRLVLADPHPLGPKSIGSATTPAVVQHDEYVPTLAICHTTMQVRPIRLSVYRTAALPTVASDLSGV